MMSIAGDKLDKAVSLKNKYQNSNLQRLVDADDYFSDVNPTCMRTLMNLLYVQGIMCVKCF